METTAIISLALLLALLAPVACSVASAQASPQATRRHTRTRPAMDAAQPKRTTAAATVVPEVQTRPRLVLLIVVDQFRYDYLERFGDLFVANGIRRLLRDGASWTEANYDHIPTETAPGHATMMTGAWPAETGIVGNDWYERETQRRVANTQDDAVKIIGGGEAEKGSSPGHLLVSTVGDELKLATDGRAKVVGISVKDRGAIYPSGRMANAAYWFSSVTGSFVSSTYYFKDVPAWVKRFNDARPADKFFGARWERLLPGEGEYLRRAGSDNPQWEIVGEVKDTNEFPHVITGGASAAGKEFYDALLYSPYTNDLLVSFAEQAIANESLGADAETDVLTVSFSANDIVGHRFGPYSHEAMDMTLRVDRHIAQLLDIVERRVGLRNSVVVFTADHGVAPVPEHAAKLGGGRVRTSVVLNAVRDALKARYGKTGAEKDATSGYIENFANNSIYFNQTALRHDGINTEEIERVAGEAALTVPGISRYFTRTQLERGAISPADVVARRALHGFNAKRSGDVLIIQEPFKYLSDGLLGATHGAPYSYDTHVPIIIMGGGLARGRYAQTATPADIAPTLSNVLRVEAPSNAAGRVLVEAIK